MLLCHQTALEGNNVTYEKAIGIMKLKNISVLTKGVHHIYLV